MAEELEALLNDPLFLRLREIRRDVEAGHADLGNRQAVSRTAGDRGGHLKATLIASSQEDREHATRKWIQSFVDLHWPGPTVH